MTSHRYSKNGTAYWVKRLNFHFKLPLLQKSAGRSSDILLSASTFRAYSVFTFTGSCVVGILRKRLGRKKIESMVLVTTEQMSQLSSFCCNTRTDTNTCCLWWNSTLITTTCSACVCLRHHDSSTITRAAQLYRVYVHGSKQRRTVIWVENYLRKDMTCFGEARSRLDFDFNQCSPFFSAHQTCLLHAREGGPS